MSVDHQRARAMTGEARSRLGFVDAVRASFEFLARSGFTEVQAEPTYLRYVRGDQFVAVFHGRASYELGVEIGLQRHLGDEHVEQRFHLRDVMDLVLPDDPFVFPSATTREQVERFVAALAAVTRAALEQLESGWTPMFDRVSEAVQRRSDEYLEDIEASRLRARADAAWRRRDFPTVVAAYDEIDTKLTTVQLKESERRRLVYARDHRSALS